MAVRGGGGACGELRIAPFLAGDIVHGPLIESAYISTCKGACAPFVESTWHHLSCAGPLVLWSSTALVQGIMGDAITDSTCAVTAAQGSEWRLPAEHAGASPSVLADVVSKGVAPLLQASDGYTRTHTAFTSLT